MIYWKKPVELVTNFQFNSELVSVLVTITAFSPPTPFFVHPKRAIVESVIEQLKHISQIEHSRHRSPTNFLVNLLAGLVAYCHRSKKPSIAVDGFVLSASA